MLSDKFIVEFDKALRSVFGTPRSQRPVPGASLPEADLSDVERRHVAGLMRVNHCGEICAQALYQGQGVTSSNPGVRDAMRQAADEEIEHLAWTEQRLTELGSHRSFLNPIFYIGALSMGMLAGRLGDKWNLGFLAETERQVEAHLDGHLARIPAHDRRSLEILCQMKADEVKHADTAVQLGAAELPAPARLAMKAASRVMTGTAYYI